MEFDQNLTRYLVKQTGRVTNKDQEKASEMVDLVQDLYRENLTGQGLTLPIQKAQIARLIEGIARERLIYETLTVVSPVCPDYSYHLDPVERRTVYDFKTLNGRIGLSAEAVLEKAPYLFTTLRRIGIRKINYLLLYADIEADDPNILESVGLTKTQFVEKVDQSCQIAKLTTSNLFGNISVQRMSTFLQEQDYQRAEKMLLLVKPNTLRSLGSQRADLYGRWFRSKFRGLNVVEIDDLRTELAKKDILKSLTFGSAARRRRVLILDSTDSSFTAFYNYGDGLPPTPVVTIIKTTI